MIVLTLTNGPPSLRGELTRWLLEIDTGVYVGRVSARVREQIWHRVQEHVQSGRAIMVFHSGTSEQGLDFRTHNAEWEPIDFDGLKLMLRPSLPRIASRDAVPEETLNGKFSRSAKMQTAKRMTKSVYRPWHDYVVIDVETTGLSPERDEMMEIGAVKVRERQVEATFQALLKINGRISPSASKLTGLTEEMLQAEGRRLEEVLPEFLAFIGDLPVIAHHGYFDYAFIRAACAKYGFPLITNQRTDTNSLAKRCIDKLANYRLDTLVDYFQIPVKRLHRSLDDCFATMQLYQKLNEIREQEL
ncbi:type I-E CRISPR-associated endoribonuclease Cas2e [Paenibacillus ginsengihumi]|uniref:type I-E CRISPR-associated endoribonuclease Cas2e n=1 Tax=Paenibacillus ginsengihumi TaxID=431596 RepID=UPI0003808457|nr:type I-E CRISPR-associated endoribonuclease Cas2e [Paenibacillus ginsengihumi]